MRKKPRKKTDSKRKLTADSRIPPAAKAIPSIPEVPREAPQPGSEKEKTRVRRKT